MQEKGNIVQYRERLNRTLASPDLTNDEILKKLVKSQVLRSAEQEIEGYKDEVVERKTAEVSNFLNMLRSASLDDGRISNTPHTDWKLRQDNEEFRVMTREGPEGSPFHTLLVEGYLDGPVDVCLCISWETSLYKTWWPQSTVPTFKIISCDCLQKVRIGEQISRVRVKVSWPLSTREAIVHYYLFEYFQDGLIIVLTKSVPESKSGNTTLYGFNLEAIPKAEDAVRIDLVGGFAFQKVSSERSYFRTIANADIKMGFVPPSLRNFVSRQLVGNGFRLYQKAVASVMNHNKQFGMALKDPMYARIREALYSIRGSEAMDGEELKQVASVVPAEDLSESKQDMAKDVSKEDKINQLVAMDSTVLDNSKAFGEIVETDSEDVVQIEEDDNIVNDIPIEEVDVSVPKGKRNVYMSPKVEQALETLQKAISMVREYGFHSRRPTFSFADEESSCTKEGGRVDSYSAKLIQQCSKKDVNVEVSNIDIQEGTSPEAPGTNSDIQNFRYTGTISNLKEVNSNRVVPTSPEENLSRPTGASRGCSHSMRSEATLDQTTCGTKQLSTDSVQDVSSDDPNNFSSDVPKKSSGRKKYRCFCFLQ